MTQENTVKGHIKRVLFKYNVYTFMPVQFGYGGAGLDFHCIALTSDDRPFPFFIEAKRPDEKPKPRQEDLINKLRNVYNCKVWVIDDETGVRALDAWLYSITTRQETNKVGVG